MTDRITEGRGGWLAAHRRCLAQLISRLPSNRLRKFFYSKLLGYRFGAQAWVGRRTVLAVDAAEIGDARIGQNNLFVGPFRLEIGDGAQIGPDNVIECGSWVCDPVAAQDNYLRVCRIGRKALIATDHFIDAAGGFELGDESWIAGRGSQFWTHGAGVTDRSVRIGRACYIGSAALFSPGSAISDQTTVALGCVVADKFTEDGLLIGGVPGRKLKDHYMSPVVKGQAR